MAAPKAALAQVPQTPQKQGSAERAQSVSEAPVPPQPPAAPDLDAPISATPDPTAPIDVTAAGARSPRAARDPDVASYVIRSDALKRPGATAIDVILATPGVQPSRTGAGSDFATLSVRGAPSAQLPVYLAGVRLNDDITGSADLSAIPLYALDRIEIYRGNAPTDADRLGIGGALFFEPRLPRGTHVGAAVGAGSFGEFTLRAFGSTGTDRASTLFSFAHTNTQNNFTFEDDRRTPSSEDDLVRTRENGDAETNDAWVLSRIALPNSGRLVLLANTFAREQGLVGSATSPAKNARSATRRKLFAASATLPCTSANDTSQCAIDISTSAIFSNRDIHDPQRELRFLTSRIALSAERFQQTLRFRADITPSLHLRAALFAGIERLSVTSQTTSGATTPSASNDLTATPLARAARLSITTSANLTWDATSRLHFFAVAAGECHTAFGENATSACTIGGPAGRAGLRIAAPFGIELTALAATYVRVPSLGELYGLSGTVLGNPSLLPERGNSAEASAKWLTQNPSTTIGAYVDLTGFARFSENLIVYKQSSKDSIRPFNVKSATTLGAELLAGIDLLRHLRAEASLTLLDPRDTSPEALDDNRLPYFAVATVSSQLEVYANLKQSVHILDRASLAALFTYRSNRIAGPTTFLPEQHNLTFTAALTLLDNHITLRFSASNLLDSNNQDLLGFALPGRAFYGLVEGTY